MIEPWWEWQRWVRTAKLWKWRIRHILGMEG